MRPSTKDDMKQQEINVAVFVADSFDQKLSPLTNSKSAVLLPMVNGILLDYVLQSLEKSGIQETYIFCCAHNQLVKSYIGSSRWSDPDSSMSVNVVSSSSFMSMGDIMRDLDSKALIRSDFVLINGPVITTYQLSTVLEAHRKLRQTDKNSAITLLYRKVLPKHKARCKEQVFLVAVESNSRRIRYYQRINNLKSLLIPLEVFQENDEVTVHYNLLDSNVSICSPCVPPLFSDNFDYQTMDDFVKGLLVNEELLGNSMYIHVAKSGYGASISNLFMYDAVSQDMIARWTYPLVPDLLELPDHKFSHSRHNIYKEPDVEIGRKCKILQNVVIGKGTKIGENTVISNSVIGRNCIIGENTIINRSYIWNDVTIGDGCNLNTCLLAERVALHKNVVINSGCVLGSEVVIDDSVTIPSCTKLQSQFSCDDDSFGEDDFNEDHKQPEEKTCDVTLVGEKGHGYLCNKVVEESEDDDEDNDTVEDIWGKFDEEMSDDDGEDTDSSSSLIPSPAEGMSEESDTEADGYDDEATYFYKEVLESLERGIEEKVKSENMILEINSSKHAYNITMKEVNTLVIRALLKMPLEAQKQDLTPQQYLAAIKPSLRFFQPLISNYIRSSESQLDCLSSVEEFMKSHENLSPAVMKVVHFWYEQDMLKESVIFKWYKNISEENERVKKQASAFVKWLQEADEESSDEECSD